MRLARPTRLLALLLVLASPAAAQRKPVAPDLQGLDSLVAALMAQSHIPGIAIGVIRDSQVVLARGYGYRDLEQKLPVTARTLFAIGSNTKSFTATLMAMLVDEGRLDWNRPVRTWLPDFQLKDDYAAANMTPLDLVSHVSGLPRHDVMWYGRAATRNEIYARLKHLEPNTSFRNIWQYNNLMFLTAGVLTERITGQTWEDQVRTRIFIPLGMTRANMSVTEVQRADDYSFPYGYRGGRIVRHPFRNIDEIGPAGSINASVEDMLKYVRFRMGQGKGPNPLVSAKQEKLMQSPRSVVPVWTYQDIPGLGPDTYGAGLAVTGYRGHRVVMHGGGIDGFISQMAWVPDQQVGVVVLTNSTNDEGGGSNAANGLTYFLLDRMLGLSPLDWVARERQAQFSADSAQKAMRAEELKNRTAGTTPSHPFDAYAGTYEHVAYGRLEVRRTGEGLEAVLDSHRLPLLHVHYDVFEVAPGHPMIQGRVTFGMDAKGNVATVAAPLEAAVAPIVFARKAP
jgi:CubicO group peptidase (beta-lactamase class C family)